MRWPERLGAALLGLSAACAVHFETPAGVEITCSADAECPGDLVCGSDARCVTRTALGKPPLAVRDVAIAPLFARAGAEVTVSFLLDGEPRAPPQVTLGGAAMTAGSDGVFRAPVPGAAPDGAREVRLSVTDTAGRSLDEALGSVTFDSTDPQLIDTAVNIDAARLGDTLFYSVVASEPLGGVPALDAGGLTMTYVDGTSYIFAHRVTSADTTGSHGVTIELTDRAGNKAPGLAGVAMVVDVDAPRLGNVRASPERVKAGDRVEILADTSGESFDDPPSSLTGDFGGHAMTCGRFGADARADYACSYDVAGDEIAARSEAVVGASIQAVDAAGNVTRGGATVVIDLAPPGLLAGSSRLDLNGGPAYPRDGCVAHASFDERSGDVSRDDISGTNFALSAGAYAPGVRGTAFDVGAGVASRPALDLPVAAAARTLAAWVRPHLISEYGGAVISWSPVDATDGEQMLGLYSGGQVVCFSVPGDTWAWWDEPAAPLDEWSHIACTYDGTTRRMYLNGVLVGESDAGLATLPGYLRIGLRAYAGPFVGAVAGLVDDATVLDRAMSAEEIAALSTGGPAANPCRFFLRTRATAVTATTGVELVFAVNEPLGALPVVTAVAPPEALAFSTTASPDDLVFAYTLGPLLGLGHVQGTYDLRIDLVDAVGNRGTLPVVLAAPGLVVDSAPPAPPDVETPDQVVLHRVPWGSEATGGQPRFWLDGGVTAGGRGPFEPGATLLAYDDANPSSATEISRALVDANGAASLTLDRDRASVWLVQADPGGNLSEAREVRYGEWFATLGGKVAGSVAENPHRLESTSRLASSLAQREAQELQGPSFGDGASESAESQGGWELRSFDGGTPPAIIGLYYYGAYDASRDRFVVITNANAHSAVWERDATRWLAAAQPTAGPIYSSMAMAYAAGRVVVLGDLATITWLWDGADWRKIDDAPVPRRVFTSMTYDSRRAEVVLFGGQATAAAPWYGQQLADTWEWDGAMWTGRPSTGRGNGATPAAVSLDATSLVVRYERGLVLLWAFDADGDAEGWEASNVASPGAPAGGVWTVATNESGAALTSPLLSLAAAGAPVVTLRLASTAASPDAALAWTRADSDLFDDTKRAPFTVVGDGAARVYTIDLAAHPGWLGRITRLRIVPNGGGDGDATLDWLRVRSQR